MYYFLYSSSTSQNKQLLQFFKYKLVGSKEKPSNFPLFECHLQFIFRDTHMSEFINNKLTIW